MLIIGCSPSQSEDDIKVERVVIDSLDNTFGYYMAVKPESEKVKGVLILLHGFGQKSEDIFLDSELHKVAHSNDIATIGFAGRMRLAADTVIQEKLNTVIEHFLETTTISPDNFFMGGFSAGGGIALRYTELCYQYPDAFPIQPKAVFMADSPVDLFHTWKLKQEDMKNNTSKISTDEGNWIEKSYRYYYGATPEENPEIFKELSPFSIDTANGKNEIYLKDVAVRAYHDIDVSWRIRNRNQTARFDNYVATSELINRLALMGNDKAEFIQSFETGYRRNGERHPHSWSIIDEEECINWIKKMIN